MPLISEIDARVIANEFLSRGAQDHVPVDPMKLQKLLYLAQGWHLAFYGFGLFRQPIEAWRFGPVVPDLYQEFRRYRASPISDLIQGVQSLDVVAGPRSGQIRELLDQVWDAYKGYSAIQLSMLTHEPGGAWDLTVRGIGTGFWKSPTIPTPWIAEEFRRKREQQPQREVPHVPVGQ
jgi:uncharacterized phage-associated protein